MPINKVLIKSVLVFLIIISQAFPTSGGQQHDKDQKMSSHFSRPQLQDAGLTPHIAEKYVKAIVLLEDTNKTGLLENYASVEIITGNLVQIRTTQGKLKEISELPFVNYIRKPKYPHNDAINEGVTRMKAQILHNFNITGNGIRIAILDAGFKDYQSLLGTALPANVITKSFRADGDISADENHGTAVTELVHSVAPGAQLYLVNYETELEFRQAVNWLIQQRVDIISHSAGYTIGPFDGTGFIDDNVNRAIDNGIVWVNSAGNYAQRHWEGRFIDRDGNNFTEFSDNGDESQNINALAGQLIEVSLSWDDWDRVNQDYELVLTDADGNIVAISEDPQNGRRGQEPAESIEYIPANTGVYKIKIEIYSATRDVFFQLYSSTNNLEYQVPSSSLAVPSDVQRVIAVGATYWNDDRLESFSSRGPTKDGRIKPDITAPDGVSTVTYGQTSFFGTSSSAPNVAGSVALLISARNLSVNEIKSALENSSLDLGPAGKDNLYGAGRIDVYNAYKQAVLPHLDILYPGSQKFNVNDTIRIGGSSNRAIERVNLTIKDTNTTLEMNAITREDGGWEIFWNSSNLSAGNYSINANLSSANASTSIILVNRSLVLSITPPVIFSGIPMNVKINARDLTVTPVSGVEVTLKGDNFTLTNTTNIDGDTLFFVTALGELRAIANKTGYPETALNLTVKHLAGIAISVPNTSMKLHAVQNFTANARDVDGFIYPIRVSWASSNISVGIIDSNGTFVAISVGTSNVTATFQNYSVSANVTVENIISGYDRNGNGRIDKDEAIQAVVDYFNGTITRQQVLDVMISYFGG